MNANRNPTSNPSQNSPLNEFYGCRREHPRQRWVADVQVCWIKGEKVRSRMNLKTADISQSGAELLKRNMVHVGRVGIMLLTDGGEMAIVRAFIVRHCRYSQSGQIHHLGIEWLAEDLHLPVFLERNEEGQPILMPTPQGVLSYALMYPDPPEESAA